MDATDYIMSLLSDAMRLIIVDHMKRAPTDSNISLRGHTLKNANTCMPFLRKPGGEIFL